MTNRLYYDAPYLTEFTARVLACRPHGDAYDVLLDQSAFYPTSGGQPFDTGTLGEARVTDVNVEDGDVWHTVTGPLEIGAAVMGRIDWPRRFDHMQQHAADHMIASALHRLMGGVTIGLHISTDVSTIDVAMPDGVTRITDEELRRIENDVNERVQRDVPIRCWFPSEEELVTLPLRKPPTVNEHVRVVAIGEDEMVACGGTHPSTAGQLGLVKIVSATPARGKMRVAFLAGQRALADYARCYEAAHRAAGLLSTGVDNLASSVAAMQEKLRAAEYELMRLRREQLLQQAQDMIDAAEQLPDGTRVIARFVEADGTLLRDFASRLIEARGVVALLGAMNGEQAIYVFGRSADVTLNMGTLLRDSARPLGGKGGGRPDFAQGGGSREILAAARQAVLASC
ncbi:MAG: alanyl-tRNA editing protein [Clostridia bacterium]|nr:alanyl-tRNA editing protein [Clostridia bacterium]